MKWDLVSDIVLDVDGHKFHLHLVCTTVQVDHNLHPVTRILFLPDRSVHMCFKGCCFKIYLAILTPLSW